MLTNEELEVLRRPFEAKDHEFLRGFVYITEEAITTRIEEVDPSWEFAIEDKWTRDNHAIVIARLSIKDVHRSNTGMQPLTITDKKTGEVKENGEPEKGATTDALKRCARLFGIGRYLLGVPDSVRDMQSLSAWLKVIRGEMPTWTLEDVRNFRAYWHSKGVLDADLYKALGIRERWGEWRGTLEAAHQTVQDYIAEQIGVEAQL